MGAYDKNSVSLHSKSNSVFEGFCMVGACTPAKQGRFSAYPKTPIPCGLATPKFAKKVMNWRSSFYIF